MPAVNVPGPISKNGLMDILDRSTSDSKKAANNSGATPVNINSFKNTADLRESTLKARLEALVAEGVPPGNMPKENKNRNKNVLGYLETSFNAVTGVIEECIGYLETKQTGDILVQANIKLQTAYNLHSALSKRISSKKHTNGANNIAKNAVAEEIRKISAAVEHTKGLARQNIDINVNSEDMIRLGISKQLNDNPGLTIEAAMAAAPAPGVLPPPAPGAGAPGAAAAAAAAVAQAAAARQEAARAAVAAAGNNVAALSRAYDTARNVTKNLKSRNPAPNQQNINDALTAESIIGQALLDAMVAADAAAAQGAPPPALPPAPLPPPLVPPPANAAAAARAVVEATECNNKLKAGGDITNAVPKDEQVLDALIDIQKFSDGQIFIGALSEVKRHKNGIQLTDTDKKTLLLFKKYVTYSKEVKNITNANQLKLAPDQLKVVLPDIPRKFTTQGNMLIAFGEDGGDSLLQLDPDDLTLDVNGFKINNTNISRKRFIFLGGLSKQQYDVMVSLIKKVKKILEDKFKPNSLTFARQVEVYGGRRTRVAKRRTPMKKTRGSRKATRRNRRS